MPTLEPKFEHLQTQINENFTTLKEYTDSKVKLIYDQLVVEISALDKKIVSVDCDLKAYNEVQDRRIDSYDHKINEVRSVIQLTKDKLDRTTKRLVELENSFNSFNFDTFLKKKDLEDYKEVVNGQIEVVKNDANDKFIVKEVA